MPAKNVEQWIGACTSETQRCATACRGWKLTVVEAGRKRKQRLHKPHYCALCGELPPFGAGGLAATTCAADSVSPVGETAGGSQRHGSKESAEATARMNVGGIVK